MTTSYTTEPRATRHARYTGPSSYVTGGDAITAADFGLSRLDYLVISATSEGGYSWAYDPSASKIKAFIGSTTTDAALAEVDTDTDLDAEVVDVIAVGLL